MRLEASVLERPLNPLELLLTSGATFIARGYSHGIEYLKQVFKEAILHKGFSLVDVLQVCVTFANMYDYYNDRVYYLEDYDRSNYTSALLKMREWDYNASAHIPLGVFYKKDRPVFEDSFSHHDKKINRLGRIKEILKHQF